MQSVCLEAQQWDNETLSSCLMPSPRGRCHIGRPARRPLYKTCVVTITTWVLCGSLISFHNINKREYWGEEGLFQTGGLTLSYDLLGNWRFCVQSLTAKGEKCRRNGLKNKNKNTENSGRPSLPNYKVIPVHFYGLFPFFFLSHMFPNTVLMSCGAAIVKSHSFWFKELQK